MELRNECPIYDHAMDWVIEAGQLIKSLMQTELSIRSKQNHSDLVTKIDEAVESFFVQKIRSHYPEHNIMGEESIDNIISDSPYTWIIDPIDGTTNLINRKQDFAISVALCKGNIGVFGIVSAVMDGWIACAFKDKGAYLNNVRLEKLRENSSLKDELLVITIPWNRIYEIAVESPSLLKLITQARGIRNYGASTIELCDIATGKLGAYVHDNIQAWDYAASRVILEEIGCKFSDFSGNEISWVYKGGIIAASPRIHQEILSILND